MNQSENLHPRESRAEAAASSGKGHRVEERERGRKKHGPSREPELGSSTLLQSGKDCRPSRKSEIARSIFSFLLLFFLFFFISFSHCFIPHEMKKVMEEKEFLICFRQKNRTAECTYLDTYLSVAVGSMYVYWGGGGTFKSIWNKHSLRRIKESEGKRKAFAEKWEEKWPLSSSFFSWMLKEKSILKLYIKKWI